MPSRSKRTRLHPVRTGVKPEVQATQALKEPIPASGTGGPAPRRTRSKVIMEVILPPSKKATPKTSSAPTPEPSSAVDSITQVQEQEELDTLPSVANSPPVRESTPRATLVVAKDKGKGKEEMDSLPPSSPPPASSPEPPAWDISSHGSTPTPSGSRSRQMSRQFLPQGTGKILVPGTPSSQPDSAPPLATQATHLPTPNSSPPPLALNASAPTQPTHLEHETQPTELEHPTQPEHGYNPPTSPIPYSDAAAPDDPFGFFAAEDRLRERRAVLEREAPNPVMGRMPSSGGPEDFDQSVYEEAFASVFYDTQGGVLTDTQASTTGSDKENAGVSGSSRLRKKRTMEVVLPTQSKAEEKEEEKEKPRESQGVIKGKGKRKAKEHILTTYELEAMLPRRTKRMRKPRTEEAERISLSEADDDDEEDSPKRRRKAAPTKGRVVASKGKSAGKSSATSGMTSAKKDVQKRPKASTSKKTTTRTSKRTRSFDASHMDDESRKRFEVERDRRLEQYKALDGYTLEEEEVVW